MSKKRKGTKNGKKGVTLNRKNWTFNNKDEAIQIDKKKTSLDNKGGYMVEWYEDEELCDKWAKQLKITIDKKQKE